MHLVMLIILQIIVFTGVIFFLRKILVSDTQSSVNRLDHVYQDLLKKQKELTEKGRYLRIRIPNRRMTWLNTNQRSANGDVAYAGTR